MDGGDLNSSLDLPSPKYLRLHAACAKVAHLSGASEAIDMIYRDLDETKVLAKDGCISGGVEINAISSLVLRLVAIYLST